MAGNQIQKVIAIANLIKHAIEGNSNRIIRSVGFIVSFVINVAEGFDSIGPGAFRNANIIDFVVRYFITWQSRFLTNVHSAHTCLTRKFLFCLDKIQILPFNLVPRFGHTWDLPQGLTFCIFFFVQCPVLLNVYCHADWVIPHSS